MFENWIGQGGLLWQILPALSPLVLIISALIALSTYRQARRTAGKDAEAANKRAKIKSSFDHIVEQTRDKDLILMNQQFKEMIESLEKKHGVGPYGYDHVHDHMVDGKQRHYAQEIITKLFNYYEATAIGIELGALEEQIIKSWWRSSYIQDWTDFKGFVEGHRQATGRPRLYEKYQAQAEKWIAET